MTWLLIFLGMSLVLNIILARAYINKDLDYRILSEVYGELEKIHDSIGKSLEKNRSKLQKAYFQGRNSKRKG